VCGTGRLAPRAERSPQKADHSGRREQSMPRVIGIGGVFIFANDAEELAGWYSRHLGFSLARTVEEDGTEAFYQELYYRDFAEPAFKLHTVFAIMSARDELRVSRDQAMINYRVDDLEAFVNQLANAGIQSDPINQGPDAEGEGKFTHLRDPEGNRIELWEHIDERTR
jgi:glyoxylase I family protein